MRRTLALSALVLAACAAPARREPVTEPNASKPAAPAANAAAPVLLPVPDDPSITFKLWVKAGSQDDPPGKEGLAMLVGEMVADASTTKNRYEDILEKLYPMAASYGARVDKEMTVLSGRCHRDHVAAFAELYEDAFLRPAWDPADFERIRTNLVNALEKSLRYAQDEELGKAALAAFVYEGTRYAHPVMGTVAGLKAITLEDARQFWRTHWTRGNVVPALGGGHGKDVPSRLQAAVAQLPEGAPAPAPAPQPKTPAGNRVLLVNKPGADASISLGYPIDVKRGEKDFYALWIANSWLGEHRNSSSHLYQVIRETRGMNYGDYSYIEAFPEGGARQMPPTHVARRGQMFEIWIRTLPSENAPFALKAAMRELQDLVGNGMTQEDFDLTRAFLSKYVLNFATTTSERLGYAVDDRFYGIGGEGHLATFRKMMGALTRDDVNAALKRHLRADRLSIAVVTGDAEGLKKKLTSGEPTPPTYAVPKGPEVLEEDKAIQSFPLNIRPEDVRIVPVETIFETAAL